ncbi:MFS transporter [Symbioplanes lichenis]|uniref:MFS transporter n=1 Tax=Symbioplanes lichenis TaxID=1629072 RepID=UPI002738B97D|nr:MFS transporter [Actinoplanes lichenis]
MSPLLPEDRGQRLLVLAILVNTVGYGIYLTAGVLYATRAIDLPAGQVGAGLSVAGVLSLLAGLPAGHLADRLGARGVYVATGAIGAAGMAGLCLTRDFWLFLVFTTLVNISQTAGRAARGPVIQQLGGERPARFRSFLRAVTNLGVAFGALVAGWGVHVDTRNAYLLLLVGCALTYLTTAVMTAFLPRVPVREAREGPRWSALRDKPYLLLTLLDGVMSLQYRVLTAALPLWLLTRTEVPKWTVAAAMLINTGVVVSLQVTLGRRVDSPKAGAVAFRRAGLAFLVSCGLISALAEVPAWAGVLLLVTGVTVHTLGEIWQSAGGFELSFALAPPDAVGQYQGVFGLGLGLGTTVAPALLIWLCVEWGTPGWWVVGALLAGAGLVVPAVARWGERTRPVTAEPASG